MTAILARLIFLWTTVPLDQELSAAEAQEMGRMQDADQPTGKMRIKGVCQDAQEPFLVPLEPEFPCHPGYTPPPELGVTGFYRDSARAHWNHTSVDRNGQFRPTILLTPDGLYRSLDGQPFPYTVQKEHHWNLVSPIR